MRRGSRSRAKLLGALVLGFGSWAVAVAPAAAQPARPLGAARVVAAEPVRSGPEEAEPAATAAKDQGEGANCLRSRKKLWVDGEGWIVRRVTTCH